MVLGLGSVFVGEKEKNLFAPFVFANMEKLTPIGVYTGNKNGETKRRNKYGLVYKIKE